MAVHFVIHSGFRYGYASKFMLNYISLMMVGLGSIAFHGTLLREGQVLDEVPMLWTSLCKLYVTATLKRSSNFLLYGIWVCLHCVTVIDCVLWLHLMWNSVW